MIFYFSATGNSKYVAERIAEATGEPTCNMLDALRTGSFDVALNSDEILGFVSPTYAWRLPSVVDDFLSSIHVHAGANAYVFFVATYGTTPGAIGHAAQKVAKRRSGFAIDALYSVRMPDNWTPMFDLSDAEAVARIVEDAEPQIDDVIASIKARKTPKRMKGQIPSIVAPFTISYYDKMRETGNFWLEDGCIGCGQCERLCPLGAIRMEDGHPAWVLKQCTMCLGCLHRCPTFAIQYGENTKAHGQYRHPKVELK